MKYSALIVAAGKGSRVNLGYNKVYYPIDGRTTILQKTLEVFLQDPSCAQIVVVTDQTDYQTAMQGHYLGKVVVVTGGESRQASVEHGLYAVTESIVLVHDGARPYLKAEHLHRLVETMEKADAALLMIPSVDTMKEVKNGVVQKTLDRSLIYRAQTPQAFKTELLLQCIKQANREGFVATDDAQLVEKYSQTSILVVEGDPANIKITVKEDLQ